MNESCAPPLLMLLISYISLLGLFHRKTLNLFVYLLNALKEILSKIKVLEFYKQSNDLETHGD